MIKRCWKTLRRAIAPAQAALLLSLSVAVPVLDGAERSRGPVLESKHSAGACVVGHDHSVCTQLSSNRVISGEGPRHGPTTGHTVAAPAHESQDTPPHVVPLARRSRAPPLG